MSRPFRLGGIIAGVVLVVLSAGTIVVGFGGRHEVSTDIKREHIVGTLDMKPSSTARFDAVPIPPLLVGLDPSVRPRAAQQPSRGRSDDREVVRQGTSSRGTL